MPDKRDFIAIFKAETEERLTKLYNGLIELEKQPDNSDLMKELNREAHTIKGSARVFGYNEIQDITHKVEDIFENVAQKKLVFNSAVADKVFKSLDIVSIILGKIAKEEKVDVDISGICSELDSLIEGGKDEKPAQNDNKLKTREPEKQESKTLEASAASQPASVIEEYIRVPVSKVDKLLNLVGEMVINKIKSSQKSAQARKLSKLVREMQKKIADLDEMVKTGSSNSDVLKLLAQCNCDVQNLRGESASLYDRVSSEVLHLEPVIDELRDRMKAMRMLACSTIFDVFPHMIRDIASKQGKEVVLEITGGQTELDKKVLEGIKTPLMHILRNCVDHGIETPDKRVACGKPRQGTIKLSAFHKAGNVIIEVADDGKGLDIEEVKQTALRKRCVSSQDIEKMTDKEIKNIIFTNGYSTSPMITDISGRGVGLDVVRHDIENLKGQIGLDSEKGEGTKFTLALPLTIAIIQVILVKTGNMIFALPMSGIEEIIKVKSSDISTIERKMAITVRGSVVPVLCLDDVLGLPLTNEIENEGKQDNEISVVITSSLDKRVGFIVDQIVSQEEIFIKGLGKHLGRIKNVSGAGILSTGEVVVILSIAGLIAQGRLSHPAVIDKGVVSKEKKKEKRILIAEDTLSTRELEKSILEANGYTVDTAVDGLDAVDNLGKTRFDLIVTDVQMPRMDGFEFCKTLRRNEKYKDIPVVMITALEKEEDKRKGLEAGVSAYIVKGAFDQANLLDAIERLIG
jgi:two-component system, chemotaxis family, sensor kinase CheA